MYSNHTGSSDRRTISSDNNKYNRNTTTSKRMDNAKEVSISDKKEDSVGPLDASIGVPGVHYFQNCNFPEIKEFLLKVHEGNDELHKPIQMLVNLYEDRIAAERKVLKDKLIQAEAQNEMMVNVRGENENFRKQLKCARDKIRELTDQQAEIVSEPILFDKLQKSKRRERELEDVISALQHEELKLRNMCNYRESSFALWNSVMPMIDRHVDIDEKLMGSLQAMDNLLTKLENLDMVEIKKENILDCDVTANTNRSDNTPNVNNPKAQDDLKLINCQLLKLLNEERLLNAFMRETSYHLRQTYKNICKNCYILTGKKNFINKNAQNTESLSSNVECEELNRLRSELKMQREILLQKEIELSALRESSVNYLAQKDEIELLKQQLKLFEEDFNMEREAKENLSRELESYKQNFTGIGIGKKTKGQIKAMNSWMDRDVAPPTVIERRKSGSNQYMCIMNECNASFNTSAELEDHCNECMGK